MGAVAIALKGGTKHYARGVRTAVFEECDLELRHGELLALLGPTGCGKSTLLRCLAGLEPLSAGHLTASEDAHDRVNAAVVFQEARLMPWLTVRENIELGLRFRRSRAAAAAGPHATDQLLELLGLRELASARPAELSGGQAQRVSVARAVIVQPRVLLLDEPFAALDPRTRGSLQRWLLDVKRELDLSVVLVTHDLDEALVMSDRIVLLSARPSRVVAEWTVAAADAGHKTLLHAEILRSYQDAVPSGAATFQLGALA